MLIMRIIPFFLIMPVINRICIIRIISIICVRPVTKCTIMYREQKAEPRSANFCTHVPVNNIPSPAKFHPNLQHSSPSISRSIIRIEKMYKCIGEIKVKCAPVIIRCRLFSIEWRRCACCASWPWSTLSVSRIFKIEYLILKTVRASEKYSSMTL